MESTDISDSALEQQKIKIEHERLKLENEKLIVEKLKAKWMAIGVGIPILVAVLTAGYGFMIFKKTSDDQFKQKMMELVIQSGNPDDGLARAEFITEILGDGAPPHFAEHLGKINTDKFGNQNDIKEDFIKLLADHPEQRASIIRDWKAFFPDDDWVKLLETKNSKQSRLASRIRRSGSLRTEPSRRATR